MKKQMAYRHLFFHIPLPQRPSLEILRGRKGIWKADGAVALMVPPLNQLLLNSVNLDAREYNLCRADCAIMEQMP